MFHAVFIPQARVKGVRNKLQQVSTKPTLIPSLQMLGDRAVMLGGGQMPLADVARVVTRIVEVVGQGRELLVRLVTIAPNAILSGILAGLQTGARRRTDRLAGETFGDVSAFLRNAVKVRRETQGAAMHPRRVMPLLIGQEDDHVGLFAGNHGI